MESRLKKAIVFKNLERKQYMKQVFNIGFKNKSSSGCKSSSPAQCSGLLISDDINPLTLLIQTQKWHLSWKAFGVNTGFVAGAISNLISHSTAKPRGMVDWPEGSTGSTGQKQVTYSLPISPQDCIVFYSQLCLRSFRGTIHSFPSHKGGIPCWSVTLKWNCI